MVLELKDTLNLTDCAIIGNYSMENFAVAVEILNTVIHTSSIHTRELDI